MLQEVDCVTSRLSLFPSFLPSFPTGSIQSVFIGKSNNKATPFKLPVLFVNSLTLLMITALWF